MTWVWAVSFVVFVWALMIGLGKWGDEEKSKAFLTVSFIAAIIMLVSAVLM